jgi:hypothetical protein
MTIINAPNYFFGHHFLLHFGLIILNPKPLNPLGGLADFFFHDLVVKTC